MKMTKLAQVRKARKITQKELALRLGVKTTTISDYERGVRSPNMNKLKAIAEAIGCEMSEIV